MDVGKIILVGQDVNLEQVTRGFAWHYKQYDGEQSTNDRKLYFFAELDASADRRVLWADVEHVLQWELSCKKCQSLLLFE